MNAIDVTIAGRGKLTNDVIKHMQWMGPVENAGFCRQKHLGQIDSKI